jgi:hypothetical protein
MRAVSSPRFHPGQLIGPRAALLYTVLLGLALLAFAVLLAAGGPASQPADGELLAPFRWPRMGTLG